MIKPHTWSFRSSSIHKYAVPLLVAGIAASVVGLTVAQNLKAQDRPRLKATDEYKGSPLFVLLTTNGIKVHQTGDYHALEYGTNTLLKDGRYKLTNGGEILVNGGRIVWDAFGVVQRDRQRLLAGPLPTG